MAAVAANRLASITTLYEMATAVPSGDVIEDDDTLTSNGRTFYVVRAQKWEPSRSSRTASYYLILEERET